LPRGSCRFRSTARQGGRTDLLAPRGRRGSLYFTNGGQRWPDQHRLDSKPPGGSRSDGVGGKCRGKGLTGRGGPSLDTYTSPLSKGLPKWREMETRHAQGLGSPEG